MDLLISNILRLPRVLIFMICITSIILIYGYFSRILGCFYFWESKTIGWYLISINAIVLLLIRIRTKRKSNKKIISEKIAICLILFMLALSGSVFFTITNSRVFTKAKDYIEKDSSINKTVGNINSIVLLPRGSKC